MMYFIVDAFANELFKGNHARVCILDKWLNNDLLQSIALESWYIISIVLKRVADTAICK